MQSETRQYFEFLWIILSLMKIPFILNIIQTLTFIEILLLLRQLTLSILKTICCVSLQIFFSFISNIRSFNKNSKSFKDFYSTFNFKFSSLREEKKKNLRNTFSQNLFLWFCTKWSYHLKKSRTVFRKNHEKKWSCIKKVKNHMKFWTTQFN